MAAAAAVAVLNVMLADGFLAEVRSKGEYLAATLAGLVAKYPGLASGIRGLGLLQGLVLTEAGVGQGQHIVNMLFDRGVLINFAGNAVLRFIPPLVVSRAQIDSLAASLDAVFSELA